MRYKLRMKFSNKVVHYKKSYRHPESEEKEHIRLPQKENTEYLVSDCSFQGCPRQATATYFQDAVLPLCYRSSVCARLFDTS